MSLLRNGDNHFVYIMPVDQGWQILYPAENRCTQEGARRAGSRIIYDSHQLIPELGRPQDPLDNDAGDISGSHDEQTILTHAPIAQRVPQLLVYGPTQHDKENGQQPGIDHHGPRIIDFQRRSFEEEGRDRNRHNRPDRNAGKHRVELVHPGNGAGNVILPVK